ncbi:MAG TPA: 3-deoxy-manno-octulosonate cytidylyltransferase [Polyangiaceae bacterium]|nr:3-deoxy-manno-octulosonate cytidylyltransferase [Polyangiaceae bacterium]
MTAAAEKSYRFGVIVPARFGSTRLPGKPLIDLGGKPMVVRVLENAMRAGAAFALVATDDERIADAVREAGGEAMLTSPAHLSGTDRLAEVVRRKGLEPELVVVNLQGDEPLLPPTLIEKVATALHRNPDARLATLATELRKREHLFDPNVVKVVIDQRGRALYFSRAPIPWVRGEFAHGTAAQGSGDLPSGAFLRHVGLYAYRVSTLNELSQAEPVPHETAESLEQLRALFLGLSIQVELVPELPAHGVDTEADLQRVRRHYET